MKRGTNPSTLHLGSSQSAHEKGYTKGCPASHCVAKKTIMELGADGLPVLPAKDQAEINAMRRQAQEAEMAALRNNVIVTHEDDLVDELIRRSEHSKLDIEVVDIVCITDLANKYMKEIGAIGDEISKT